MTTEPTAAQMLDAILDPAALAARPTLRSREFAAEIGNSFRVRLGRGLPLSSKQEALLRKLHAETVSPSAAPVPAAAAPLEGSGIAGVRDLFAKAVANGGKRPGIRVRCEGVDLHLTLAGAESANPGFIYVKAEGFYVGKIDTRGGFRAGRDCTPEAAAALSAFGNDPLGAALAHGRETGACCFCSLTLDDDRSKEVGYGQRCAQKYGLPWGQGEAKAPPRTRRKAAPAKPEQAAA